MRNKKFLAFITTLALILVTAGGAFAALSLSNFPAGSSSNNNPIVPIVKRASLAVVNIDVEKITSKRSQRSPFPFDFDDDPIFKHFFGDNFREYNRSVPMKGRGSGFIVSKEGLIITNNHVVDKVDKITVSVLLADGSKKTYEAKLQGSDPTYDLAVIKIEPDAALPVLELGDSDALEVGEWVIAIGNPYGFEHTVTAGIISAKNRSVHGGEVNFDDFLQTDAAINPGNSGGPLLDMNGKVIGINAAIAPFAQGLGFAIPVNRAKEIMGDLISVGHARRGWLGVGIGNVTPQMAKIYGGGSTEGAMINDVFKGDPADKAGIKRGDIVIEINGDKIKDAQALTNKIRSLAPGSTAKIVVIRRGKKMTFNVKLDERAADPDSRNKPVDNKEKDSSRKESDSSTALKDFGINRISRLDSSNKRRYGFDSEAQGVIISEVSRNSPAYNVGIREGDLLLEVNAREVMSPEDVAKAIGKDDALVLLIERDKNTFFIQIEKDKSSK